MSADLKIHVAQPLADAVRGDHLTRQYYGRPPLLDTGVLSQPGCVLASPYWENTATNVSQDYVYNWTRDAVITAIELAAGPLPTTQPLIDYVQFAQTCQNSASSIGHFDRASFLINGTPRNWTDQTDGPALQTLAILRLYAQLDAPTQAMCYRPIYLGTIDDQRQRSFVTGYPGVPHSAGH